MNNWKKSAHRKRGGKTDNDRRWIVKQFVLMWSVHFLTWNKKISWTKTLNHDTNTVSRDPSQLQCCCAYKINHRALCMVWSCVFQSFLCKSLSPQFMPLQYVCCMIGLLNPADPPMSQSMWAQAVQPNIVQTHRHLVHIPAEILKPPKRPVCLWEMCKTIMLETYSREEKKEYWLRYLFFMTVTVWKEMSFPNLKQSACLLKTKDLTQNHLRHTSDILKNPSNNGNNNRVMRPRLQMHVLRSSRAAFPMMPEGRAAYDNRQKSWLGRSRRLHSVIPLSARLPPSPIIPPKWSWHLVCISWTPETDSWVTESGLCGRIMTAEAKSSWSRKYSSLRWTQTAGSVNPQPGPKAACDCSSGGKARKEFDLLNC